MTDPVFVVVYGCHNCGGQWTERYPARMKIGSTSGRTQSWSKDCGEMGTTNCECCNIVVCPFCELYEDVYVDDRYPIEDDGGETA